MKTCCIKDLIGKPILYIMQSLFYTRCLVKFDESYYCLLCINDRTIYGANEDEIVSFFVSTNSWNKCDDATVCYNADRLKHTEVLDQPCNLIHKNLIAQWQPEILRRQAEYNKSTKV